MNVNSFRKLGFIEGISFLLLLFVAMPLKYAAGMPEAVRVIGMIHGMLFMAYLLLGSFLREELGWSNKKLAFACLAASLPFGPFIFDAVLFPGKHTSPPPQG